MTTCVHRGIQAEAIKSREVRLRPKLVEHRASRALAQPRKVAVQAVGKYVHWALVHPYNVLAMVVAAVLSLISWSLVVLVVAVALEMLFLSAVPALGLFRRFVAASVERAERAAQVKARETLVEQMGQAHRDELGRLEGLIQKTRSNAKRNASAVGLTDDSFGLDRLTASYIQLAIAHRTCEESLAMSNRMALADTIMTLEAMQPTLPERTRRVVARRLSIAHQRAQCWDRTREHCAAITHELATILELVHLMHDRSVTTRDSRDVVDEVERFLTDLEDNEGVLLEVAEIGGSADDLEDAPPVVRSLDERENDDYAGRQLSALISRSGLP
jgi:hypothetical protein